jgi:BirA family biotin operon repressor/biotin-[acetyl-CoA-carboxylase] ligase
VMSRQFTYVPVVTSTSDVAKRLAEEGCGEGTVVVADFQTEGRGRLGRRWEAPPGSSLLLSIVFRPCSAALP